ncbi:hypothetical protein ZIOFF_068050 [Zingiber officinale]|uniref:SLC26A/SulP transporter domain-containing protein n=1 Tax=Zingiber officinale TaxID=94328 RepID=A0A8J5CGI8_ZINOF|nr:hypothetical protein ZIOFF_068050 [Zingiber officinale]
MRFSSPVPNRARDILLRPQIAQDSKVGATPTLGARDLLLQSQIAHDSKAGATQLKAHAIFLPGPKSRTTPRYARLLLKANVIFFSNVLSTIHRTRSISMPTLVAGRYELDRMEANLRRKGSFFTSLREDLRESFLPEDPFRRRPDEVEWHQSSRSTLMLNRVFTGSALDLPKTSRVVPSSTHCSHHQPLHLWVRFDLSLWLGDLLAGFTVAILAVPQGISYARLAYLHLVISLYSSFIPSLIYAIFGSSTNVVSGDIAAVSLFLVSAIGAKVSPVDHLELYTHLLFTAFFTGLFQAALDIFR